MMPILGNGQIVEPETQRIQRKRTKGFNLQAASPNGLPVVSVTRPGKWGNPFAVGKDGPLGRKPIDDEGAVGFFAAMFTDDELRAAAGYPPLAEIRSELRGKNLACFCDESARWCHADILLKLAAED